MYTKHEKQPTYRQIGKHESFEGKMNRLKLQRKSSMEQICHCINFYCFKIHSKMSSNYLATKLKKYSELEDDSFYPPMICVCQFDGIP